jgi:DNA (cytosine-5)-methyltransferase 1
VTFGSLFAGIGGIDLGLERAGMECKWQVEIDPWCRRVLEKHWPDVPKYEDVKTVEGLESVDLICGGFPCQPVSVAGKRLGQADARWLWPEFARIVRMVRPYYVLVENVPGLLVGGMGDVLGDLAEIGYDAEWGVLSAKDMGAPHLRKRVFVIGTLADANNEGLERRNGEELSERTGQLTPGESGPLADAKELFRDERDDYSRGDRESMGPLPKPRDTDSTYDVADAPKFPEREQADETEPVAGSGDSRTLPRGGGWWVTEPNVGRVAHGVPNRVDRLRGLGNAVVPQCAEWLGRRIIETGPYRPGGSIP